jgi:hypothetical protein
MRDFFATLFVFTALIATIGLSAILGIIITAPP